MQRGKKPVPTALRVIRGNTNRRPIPEGEFQPDSGEPVCPPHLRPEAVLEFSRLLGVLRIVLTPADRTVLAVLCTSWARHVNAELHLAETGDTVLTQNGMEIQSPWLGISNRAAILHCKLCCEFGLTPSSRTRVHTGVKKKPEGAKEKGWGQFG